LYRYPLGPAIPPPREEFYPPMSPEHPSSPSHPHFGSSPSHSPSRQRAMGKPRSNSIGGGRGAAMGSASPGGSSGSRTPTRSASEMVRARRRGSLGSGKEYEWSVSPKLPVPLDLRDSPTYLPQMPAWERNRRRQSRKASGMSFEIPNDVDGLHLSSPHRYRDSMEAGRAAAAAVARDEWPEARGLAYAISRVHNFFAALLLCCLT
jgi:hypothetical protein